MDIGRYLDARLAEGSLDSSGAFTVNWQGRDRLMKELFLSQPGLWMVKVVQAAVALGSTALRVKVGTTRVQVSFRCPEPPDPRAVFDDRPGEVEGLLGLGLAAAQAERPHRLTYLVEGDPGAMVSLNHLGEPVHLPLVGDDVWDRNSPLGGDRAARNGGLRRRLRFVRGLAEAAQASLRRGLRDHAKK
ncbi:MAG: hypothetical protein AB7S38_28255 [Vulcanimicrobiota bacterium]